jgi:N utilization substance protein B
MGSPTEPGRDRSAGHPRRSGHRRRRSARRQAIEILYQADLLDRSPQSVLEEWRSAGRSVSDYAAQLVAGVAGRLAEIDARIGSNSEGWPVYRMPVLDRTILRVACFELASGVPVAVAISEAVHTANELSTGDSGRFVNGVLGAIVRDPTAAPSRDED